MADLTALFDSWLLHLRAERKSTQTIKSYGDGVRLWLAWCERTGHSPTLDRRTVNAFVAELLESGLEPATARARQLSLRRFSAWLAEEGEIDRDELLGLKPPKLDDKVIDSLTVEQVTALIAACSGKEFRDRRDEAIVRLMVNCGVRSDELLSMTVPEVDLTDCMVVVRRGKGGKGRRVSFDPKTGRSIDRYLRLRRTHRLADTPTLWLGDRGKNLGYYGLRDTLQWRAGLAGIEGFTNHQLRHTFAAMWLDKGGSEGGLMASAGWTRRDMIDRYVKSTSERRAADESRRLAIGDQF
jgi:site-specific recombinase XerD